MDFEFDKADSETNKTFEESVRRSNELKALVLGQPENFRVLTGDRPTGSLHIGHLFGSLQNRVILQNSGITTFLVIADYQVFTDRETSDNISSNVTNLILDYLAAGMDPECGRTFIFCHSQIPELNQLLLPFLSLVSMQELDRNPTVKEEIRSARLNTIQAIMYCYPVHQAADILFCGANLVPVGKDQLPHLELTRKIARRFNERFGGNRQVLSVPEALLSDAPSVLGLDGTQKMSKSRGNAIFLSDSADETRKKITKATTDSIREITYDPENRPQVANFLRLISLITGEPVEVIADKIGSQGAGKLKELLTEVLNSYLDPLRKKRQALAASPEIIRSVLKAGMEKARGEATQTLENVSAAMGMKYL